MMPISDVVVLKLMLPKLTATILKLADGINSLYQ